MAKVTNTNFDFTITVTIQFNTNIIDLPIGGQS